MNRVIAEDARAAGDDPSDLSPHAFAYWLDGRRVGIPAGTVIARHTHPTKNLQGQRMPRAQEVKVNWASYNQISDTITINWAGTGGYWKGVDIPLREVVVL